MTKVRKVVNVAAAVILDKNDQVFLAKRPSDKDQGGLWEFPGGKIETGESPEQALTRELQEELGIDVLSAEEFMILDYDYPDKSVCLMIYTVQNFLGSPWGKEGQEAQWYSVDQLDQLTFPDANQPIIDKLIAQCSVQ